MGKSKDKDRDREKDVKSSFVEEEPATSTRDQPEEKSQDRSMVEFAERPPYSELVQYINAIAKPLAGKKLTKRLHKTVKKAAKLKSLRRGVKEVVKALRKGEKGVVVIAGDISPIDVITHVPIMCEDRDMPYAYVPSKMDLGIASLTKRPTSVVMIKHHADIDDHYTSCFTEVKALPLPI